MTVEKTELDSDYGKNYEKKVAEAVDYLSGTIYFKFSHEFSPKFGIVLGSGLGDLANSIEGAMEIPYSEIPNFPQTTIPGHDGKLILGKLEGVDIIGLKGRKHYYEVADQPYGILQTVFPVHVLAELGVPNYFVTNAAGGLNLDYNVGDIMVIDSHINGIFNPLLGKYHDFMRINDGKKVWRFQPLNEAYDTNMSFLLWASGMFHHSGNTHHGTYIAVPGPNYETKAECIAFRRWGADAVGMSTANEVIVAKNRGMNVVGFSCITNKIAENGTNATNHEEVKEILESEEVKKGLELTVKMFFNAYNRH